MPERSLSVLVVGMDWPPETFLDRLLRGLADAGLEVTVASGRRPDAGWLAHPRRRWLPAPEWNGSAPGRLWKLASGVGGAALRSPKDLRRLADRAGAAGDDRERLVRLHRWLPYAGRRWDVIYFPWNAGAVNYLPLAEQATTVISCRGAQINIAPHNPERAALREGLRRSFSLATAVHCVSEAIKREAVQYGLDPSKAVVIRPAVDPEHFRPLPGARRMGSAPLRLVTTGSLIWRKGYEYMLSAVRCLLDRGVPVHLDIIGDGPERQRVLYTIHDLDLVDHVTLRGRRPPEEVLRALQEADVFVLSSLSEGISNAVLEAMACGLPVVTTNCGGMAEAVGDGVEGYLVPPRRPEVMADALQTLWEQPSLRRTMGEAGRLRTLRDFTLSEQIDAFVALLRHAANGT